MTNPTSNYGFVLPTSTDLVTDLPADFEVALQGVDTRLKALQPGTTLGDIAYSSATANTNTRLPIGTSGQVLAVSGGGVPAWTTTADVTPLTTKGDLFTFTTADARLGVGTDGQTLVADSSTATGLKWASAAAAATSYTLLNSGGTSLSGSTTTISGLSGYNKLFIIISNFSLAAPTGMWIRFNGDTGSNYRQAGFNMNNDATWSTSVLNGVYGNLSDKADIGVFYGTTQVGGFTMSIDGCNSSGVKVWDTSLGIQAAVNAMFQGMGTWTNSSAISSISFIGQTQNWDGGTVYIYGA